MNDTVVKPKVDVSDSVGKIFKAEFNSLSNLYYQVYQQTQKYNNENLRSEIEALKERLSKSFDNERERREFQANYYSRNKVYAEQQEVLNKVLKPIQESMSYLKNNTGTQVKNIMYNRFLAGKTLTGVTEYLNKNGFQNPIVDNLVAEHNKYNAIPYFDKHPLNAMPSEKEKDKSIHIGRFYYLMNNIKPEVVERHSRDVVNKISLAMATERFATSINKLNQFKGIDEEKKTSLFIGLVNHYKKEYGKDAHKIVYGASSYLQNDNKEMYLNLMLKYNQIREDLRNKVSEVIKQGQTVNPVKVVQAATERRVATDVKKPEEKNKVLKYGKDVNLTAGKMQGAVAGYLKRLGLPASMLYESAMHGFVKKVNSVKQVFADVSNKFINIKEQQFLNDVDSLAKKVGSGFNVAENALKNFAILSAFEQKLSANSKYESMTNEKAIEWMRSNKTSLNHDAMRVLKDVVANTGKKLNGLSDVKTTLRNHIASLAMAINGDFSRAHSSLEERNAFGQMRYKMDNLSAGGRDSPFVKFLNERIQECAKYGKEKKLEANFKPIAEIENAVINNQMRIENRRLFLSKLPEVKITEKAVNSNNDKENDKAKYEPAHANVMRMGM